VLNVAYRKKQAEGQEVSYPGTNGIENIVRRIVEVEERLTHLAIGIAFIPLASPFHL
jgi:hypothetical protein